MAAGGYVGLLGAARPGALLARDPRPDIARWIERTLATYIAFGDKFSGGPGDMACGKWIEDEFLALEFRCRRQDYMVPSFAPRKTELVAGDSVAQVIPQAVVVSTGPAGCTARIRPADHPDLTNAIALILLPQNRWYTLHDPRIQSALSNAFAKGAAAAILVTTGVTGKAIALNVDPHRSPFNRPVAVLAPEDAAPFVEAAKADSMAKLVIDGASRQIPAFNVIAQRGSGNNAKLILSTPRSGWFTCAAERGSGLVVWLGLARWLARLRLPVDIELLCTSGHEYNYLGGEKYLEQHGMLPNATWVHIGASAAARDWHELRGQLLPLPSADPQRFLVASPDIIDLARHNFDGIAGLEATYPSNPETVGGEMTAIFRAGYRSVMGLYGGHRYFHTREDDARCVSPDLITPLLSAYQQTLHDLISRRGGSHGVDATPA